MVTIEVNNAALGQPVATAVVAQGTVQAGSVETFALPTRELDCGVKPNDYASPGTCLSSNAFRITSSAPVSVVQLNPLVDKFSNDASLLLPTHLLGTMHRVVGWGAGHPIPLPLPTKIIDRSYVTIVGVQAGTKVKVKPSWRIRGNPPIAATAAGGEINVTLGPFDVLNLETDDATAADPAATRADLSGTFVASDKAVAVFSGVESAQVPGALKIATPPGWKPGDTCCLDHLEAQVLPVEGAGTSFVISRSPVRASGGFKEADVIRFVGVTQAAQVTTNLPAPFNSFSLNPGEVKTTSSQGHVTVSSTQPIVVAQLLVSNQLVDSTKNGDPSLTIFPSVGQYQTDFLVPTPASWTNSYLVITQPKAAKVTLNGSAPAGCTVESAGTVGGVSYDVHTCPLTTGASHRVASDQPVGVIAYGYAANSSYAFVAGVGL